MERRREGGGKGKEGGRSEGEEEGGSISSLNSSCKNLQSGLGAPPVSTSVKVWNQILELPCLLLFHLQ